VADLAKAGSVAVAVTVVGAVLHPLLSSAPQPASVFVIYGLVTIVLVTASRASYVVLRASQRRASHQGVPVLVYGAGKHGIAATEELFENPATGLKPIAFVDDDAAKTGMVVDGLPVLGRSYELEAIVTRHHVKAVVIASPALPPECHARIANASRRLGIGLFRLNAQVEQVLETTSVDEREPIAVPAQPAAVLATASAGPRIFECEPCPKCGGRDMRRSRATGMYERFRKLHTPTRPFRCDDCGWRGWLLPLEHTVPFHEVAEPDLRSLDSAFSSLSPIGEGRQRE
jgi:hypothetical protein